MALHQHLGALLHRARGPPRRLLAPRMERPPPPAAALPRHPHPAAADCLLCVAGNALPLSHTPPFSQATDRALSLASRRLSGGGAWHIYRGPLTAICVMKRTHRSERGHCSAAETLSFPFPRTTLPKRREAAARHLISHRGLASSGGQPTASAAVEDSPRVWRRPPTWQHDDSSRRSAWPSHHAVAHAPWTHFACMEVRPPTGGQKHQAPLTMWGLKEKGGRQQGKRLAVTVLLNARHLAPSRFPKSALIPSGLSTHVRWVAAAYPHHPRSNHTATR